MTVTAVYDMNKKKVGDIDLPDAIFAAPVNNALLHHVVCVQLSNKRQGNASTKGRGTVRGGGKKPYKQKGTGRARHGSIRSPIFVGGGAAFGPRPRNWHIEMPKKERRAALKMALSMKNKDGSLFVVDKWASGDGKTGKMAKTLDKWKAKSNVIVNHEADEKTVRAIRNIPNTKMVSDKNLNVYDVLKYEHLLVTKGAVESIIAKFGE